MSHNSKNPMNDFVALNAMRLQHQSGSDWNPETWSVLGDTDAYKVSMDQQYNPDAEYLTSYAESRGGEFENMVFFGAQQYASKLTRRITSSEVKFYDWYWRNQGMPFPVNAMNYIVDEMDGRIPISIDSVDEGTVLPVQNSVARMETLHPVARAIYPLIETSFLRAVWYPSTVATLSWHIKQDLLAWLDKTVDEDRRAGAIAFMLHDFGSRGASSCETAKLGGTGHLINFMGTDTGVAPLNAALYYGADLRDVTTSGSVPAMEHSTVTSYGRDGEVQAYTNMLDVFDGPGIKSMVIDSYDVFNAAENILGDELRDRIVALGKVGGRVVGRPDSGDPVEVSVKVVEIFLERFGYTTNSRGFKVLPDCVRVLQGDGVNRESINAIMQALYDRGISAENIVFGMGGALLQAANRDDMKWAMKTSAYKSKDTGAWMPVYKDPVTDQGKASKKGRLGLVYEHGVGSATFRTKEAQYIPDGKDELKPLYSNGDMQRLTTFEEVRQRSNNPRVGIVRRKR